MSKLFSLVLMSLRVVLLRSDLLSRYEAFKASQFSPLESTWFTGENSKFLASVRDKFLSFTSRFKSWIAFKIAIFLPFSHSISNMQLDRGLFSPNPSWSLIVTWVLPLTPRTFQELPRLKKSASFSVFFISVRRFASQSVAIWSLRSQNSNN